MSSLPEDSDFASGLDLEECRRQLARMIERERELLETIRRLEERPDPEFIRLERLHALEAMSRGVAHNFNNILVGVMGYAQLTEMQSEDPMAIRNAGEIVRCAERARELVQRLSMSVARPSRGKSEILPLESIVSGVLDATRPRWKDEAEAKGIQIECVTDIDETGRTAGLSVDVHYTLVHLVFNAIDAVAKAGGRITIRARQENGRATIQVVDNGIGMDDATRLRIFEPFFTTKQDVGSGLGLSVVYRAVTDAGGEIQVDSSPGEGTDVAISLPVEEVPPRPDHSDPAPRFRSVSAERILVIDDEFAVREVMEQALHTRTVSTFPSGEEALRSYIPGGYDVAFIDLGMPGMPGNEVARRLKILDPPLIAVLVTGWELTDDDPIHDHFDYHLRKPFRIEAVQDLITALESGNARTTE